MARIGIQKKYSVLHFVEQVQLLIGDCGGGMKITNLGDEHVMPCFGKMKKNKVKYMVTFRMHQVK
jgi:hypothetical protein